MMFRRIPLGEEVDLGMPSPVVELFVVTGRDRTCVTMARHVRTPQMIAATDGGRWGMWLAAPGAAPVSPQWIELRHDEALLIEPGVWHHGPIPLDRSDGTYLTVEAPRTNTEDFETATVR